MYSGLVYDRNCNTVVKKKLNMHDQNKLKLKKKKNSDGLMNKL